jgi:hypothetical protein
LQKSFPDAYRTVTSFNPLAANSAIKEAASWPTAATSTVIVESWSIVVTETVPAVA